MFIKIEMETGEQFASWWKDWISGSAYDTLSFETIQEAFDNEAFYFAAEDCDMEEGDIADYMRFNLTEYYFGKHSDVCDSYDFASDFDLADKIEDFDIERFATDQDYLHECVLDINEVIWISDAGNILTETL